LPAHLSELAGDTQYLPPKAFNIPQGKDDVFIMSWCGAGGYGDPLERDPESVRKDVVEGTTTRSWASDVYAVVLDREDKIDSAATAKLRDARRAERLKGTSRDNREKLDTSDFQQVHEGLMLGKHGGDAVLACRKCLTVICPASENYKQHCVVQQKLPADANPNVLPPTTYIDDEVVFRLYACPGCGLLLQTELLRPGDQPLWDLQISQEKRSR
jgi:N-methylhydantoinase B